MPEARSSSAVSPPHPASRIPPPLCDAALLRKRGSPTALLPGGQGGHDVTQPWRPTGESLAHARRPASSSRAMAEAYAPVEAALGPEENFLSLADILMSQERLPCRAEIALPRLGVVLAKAGKASLPDNALPEGSKIEIPLWLAKGLYDNKRRILSVALPKIYKESWRTVFNADATVVDLHKLGPYYYGFGSQLLNFDNPENTELAQTVLQTFTGRFRRIMDSSQNAFNEDTSSLTARLDELERALFQTGQQGLHDFQSWEMGQASQITTSSLVQNYKKRKFTDMDS